MVKPTRSLGISQVSTKITKTPARYSRTPATVEVEDRLHPKASGVRDLAGRRALLAYNGWTMRCANHLLVSQVAELHLPQPHRLLVRLGVTPHHELSVLEAVCHELSTLEVVGPNSLGR